MIFFLFMLLASPFYFKFILKDFCLFRVHFSPTVHKTVFVVKGFLINVY